MMADNEDKGQSDSTLDISLEDLEEDSQAPTEPEGHELPPAMPPADLPGDTLVIESEDLTDVPATPPAYPAPGNYPAVESGAYAAVAGKGKQGVFSGGLVGSLLIQMLIAGALGGLLAWAINEPMMNDYASEQHLIYQVLITGLFFTIVGGVIGLFLGAVEGISTANSRKALLGALTGLGIGAVGGFIAGAVGEVAYFVLLNRHQTNQLTLGAIFARTVGWTLAGMFIGLGQGAMARSLKKAVNGLCGGAIGGFIGGMLFDPIGMLMTGLMSRLVALVVIGAATGAAIGLIEELRKEAWVLIVGGPLTGKQFILYRQATTIGSSPACDIALLKDPHIAPQHCVIEVAGGHYVLRDLGSGTGTLVNGNRVQQHALRRGDVIQIGQTAIEYQDRSLPASPVR